MAGKEGIDLSVTNKGKSIEIPDEKLPDFGQQQAGAKKAEEAYQALANVLADAHKRQPMYLQMNPTPLTVKAKAILAAMKTAIDEKTDSYDHIAQVLTLTKRAITEKSFDCVAELKKLQSKTSDYSSGFKKALKMLAGIILTLCVPVVGYMVASKHNLFGGTKADTIGSFAKELQKNLKKEQEKEEANLFTAPRNIL